MFKISFLFFFVFVASQVKSTAIKNPYDIVAEVTEQLQELRSTVQGSILAAHNDLSDLEYDFTNYGENVIAQGEIAIEQEEATINSQLTTLNDLANSANKDISSCTDIRQELLERLPQEHIDTLKSCVVDKNHEEASVVSDAKYIIDITINKVHNLEFQVRQCREDLQCLSPLMTEIQLAKIRLPQNINTEVSAVESLLTSLRLSVQQCSDSSVSDYAADANSILQDITKCVDSILG